MTADHKFQLIQIAGYAVIAMSAAVVVWIILAVAN